MKMGLNVVRVWERLAQGDDRPRIGEVLLDASDCPSLAHLNTFLSHLRWRAALDRLYRSIQLRDRRRRLPAVAKVFVPLKVVGLVESDLSSLPRKKKIK